MSEVRRHTSDDSLWMVANGFVYDLTKFFKIHPGGSKLIKDAAGKDASGLFNSIHPSDLPERLLGPECIIGKVDAKTILPHDRVAAPPPPKKKTKKKNMANTPDQFDDDEEVKTTVNQVLNFFDFIPVAKQNMTEEGWGYYSSGADDELSLRDNRLAFQRVWLKPRILVNVKHVDTTATLCGYTTKLPLYFTATALGRLAHPDGEVAISEAAGDCGLIYMLPTLSSCSFDEMVDCRKPGQVHFAQLYVNAERQRTKELVMKMEQRGCKALCITVDAPQLGKREKDMRAKLVTQAAATDQQTKGGDEVDKSQGVARAISSFIDPSLSWKDITWFKSITKMPLILKGVQTGEDALKAYQYGCKGVVLSNHGGRQLDTARSGLEILPEVIRTLHEHNVKVAKPFAPDNDGFVVMVDGGFRRGSDIFKALALGATACGIGRPVLYSLAAFGRAGILKMIQCFKAEMDMTMRLMGTQKLNDIDFKLVAGHSLSNHPGDVAFGNADALYRKVYDPLAVAGLKPARL